MKQHQRPLILVLDVGSSSVRGLLFNCYAMQIPEMEVRRPLGLSVGQDGACELDADRVLTGIFSCLDDIVAQAGPAAGKITGVGICTFVSNLMGLDKDGRPVTGLLTYADTRSAPQATGLKQRLDQALVHQRTGCLFHPCYLTAQLAYLRESRPDAFGRAVRWVSLGEYLELTLFGQTAVSVSVASWTGLMDRTRLVWDEELLTALNLKSSQFSTLTDLDCPRRGLKTRFAQRWPALARAAWFPSIGDGAAANVGCGCLDPGRVALTVGTSAALRVIPEHPPEWVPQGLFCYRVDRVRVLLGGALTEGGGLYEWCNDNLKLAPVDRIEAALGAMEPDSHGLTVLPFWSGERCPGWAGHARGCINGLNPATGPMEILRAVIESVALRLAAVHALLKPHLDRNHVVVASGGALVNSPVWVQIVADALGRPVLVPKITEAAAQGVARLVLEAMGRAPDSTSMPPPAGTTRTPDQRRHLIYRNAARRQQNFYNRIIDRVGVTASV